MNSRRVAIGLVAVLLFSAVGGLLVGSVGATSGNSIVAVDDGSGNTTQHNVTVRVDGNAASSSLNEIVVDYSD